MKKHYELGPSAAPGWARCAAKPARERGIPNTSSEFADSGTVDHDLGEQALLGKALPALGTHAYVEDNGDVVYSVEDPSLFTDKPVFKVDAERMQVVQTYVDYVQSIPGDLLVEQRLPIDHVTGEEGGSGTSDAIKFPAEEITVIDLKGGQGVRVSAYDDDGDEAIDALTGEVTRARIPNFQALMYGLGALREYGWMGDFKRMRLVIVQPRLDHISEHVLTIDEANTWAEYLKEKAEATRDPFAVATPGEKQCKFCRAKATCAEFQEHVLKDVLAGFPDRSEPIEVRSPKAIDLGTAMRIAPMLEDFIKAVRAEVERRLFAGENVDGYKLVTGRKGHRAWSNPEEAASLLRGKFKLKLEDAFNMTLISPPQAEALLKKDHPRQWAQLTPLIRQPDGKPSVASIHDPRPALVVAVATDAFADLTTAAGAPADVADLF